MKIGYRCILLLAMLGLTACNFSLASDITPPPDYVAPSAMPTLGALFPAASPNPQDGGVIYAQNCLACHGDKGLGDGPQSMQLPVAVPGIGLAQVARLASPAQWFKIVTQGNLDRFMPPFGGVLSDQQRWDVISYILTLHSTPDQVAKGKSLFNADCAACAAKFMNQSRMSALSEEDLVRAIKNGQADIPAFGKSYSDEDAYSVAAYLRTLTFAPVSVANAAGTANDSSQTPQAANGTSLPPTETSLAASSSGTPVPSTLGEGIVSGSVQMADGSPGTSLTVKLHGFDHAQDQTTGPKEVLTLSGTTASDGTYKFESVAMPVNRIFLAEVDHAGITYRSNFQSVVANQTSIALPALKLFDASTDASQLTLNQVHIYTDFASAGTVQVLEILAFSNSSDKSIVISSDGTTIPFIALPAGAQNPGFEAGQDSAPFVAAGKGLAAVPSDTPYSIIAFFSMPYSGKLQIKQPLSIDAPSVVLLVPAGMQVSGKQFTDKGLQVIQNNNYREFSASDLKAGEVLSFAVNGNPLTGAVTGIDFRQGWLIGGGVLGIALILAGVFLFLKDRKTRPEPVGAEFSSSAEVMDAILALDDLHRASKISTEAYKKRREELKELLRERV